MMAFPKSGKKHHNKHRHHVNEHLVEWTPCFVCTMENGSEMARGAYATHEIFHNGSAYMRNLSISYGAQIHVCMMHDKEIHESNGVLDRKLKRIFQGKIMAEHNMDLKQWVELFRKSEI